MRADIRRRFDAHTRTSDVCARHRTFFDATGGGATMRTALVTYVADVERHLAGQEQSIEDRRAATAQLARGRRILRDYAAAVVKVGRVVEIAGVTMSTMRLPGSISDDQLLAYTRGLLDRVLPYQGAFEAHGLLPGLLQTCAREIDRFVAAKHRLAQARQQFTASTQTIRLIQSRAAKAIDVLETIAITTPAAPTEALSELRIAKRIGPRAARQIQHAAHETQPAAHESDLPSALIETLQGDPSRHDADAGRRVFVVVRVLARAFRVVFPDEPDSPLLMGPRAIADIGHTAGP